MNPFQIQWPNGPATGAMWLILALATLFNSLMTIFWIFVGWRAMKAHERLPDALAAVLRRRDPPVEPQPDA